MKGKFRLATDGWNSTLLQQSTHWSPWKGISKPHLFLPRMKYSLGDGSKSHFGLIGGLVLSHLVPFSLVSLTFLWGKERHLKFLSFIKLESPPSKKYKKRRISESLPCFPALTSSNLIPLFLCSTTLVFLFSLSPPCSTLIPLPLYIYLVPFSSLTNSGFALENSLAESSHAR